MGHSEPTHQDYKDLPTHSYIRNYLQFPSLELIERGLEPWLTAKFDLPVNLCITREQLFQLYRTGKDENVRVHGRQWSKNRMGATETQVRHITRMALQIWLPNFQWRSKQIDGIGNIAEDINNLIIAHGNDVLINIPFILNIKNFNRMPRGGHTVIGFVNNRKILFKNSHGEVTPTEFDPENHRLMGSAKAIYNFITFRPYGWDKEILRDIPLSDEEDTRQDIKISKILKNSTSAHDEACMVKKHEDTIEHIDIYKQFYDDGVPNIPIGTDMIDILEETLDDPPPRERDRTPDPKFDEVRIGPSVQRRRHEERPGTFRHAWDGMGWELPRTRR